MVTGQVSLTKYHWRPDIHLRSILKLYSPRTIQFTNTRICEMGTEFSWGIWKINLEDWAIVVWPSKQCYFPLWSTLSTTGIVLTILTYSLLFKKKTKQKPSPTKKEYKNRKKKKYYSHYATWILVTNSNTKLCGRCWSISVFAAYEKLPKAIVYSGT